MHEMTVDEFGQSLESDSLLALSYVPDSQLFSDVPDTQDADVFEVPRLTSQLVETPNLASENALRKAAAKEKKSKMGTTMKWPPFLSMFVLNKMCELISSGIRTDKEFKEVHLNTVAKLIFDLCGQEVTSTQVYNHLSKWRSRWIKISKLKYLSGAQWDDDTHSIILEIVHLKGHIKDHPKDAEFLNKPIQNYDQMQTIFSFGLATGRHDMGSSEPLGSPDEPDTQESETIKADVAGENHHDTAPKPAKEAAGGKKRKRGALVDEEVLVFISMTEAVREVASAIRESVSVDVDPGLYEAVMTTAGYIDAAKMVAFSHLLDNKAQGQGFVKMAEDHQKLWLHTFLTKHYYV